MKLKLLAIATYRGPFFDRKTAKASLPLAELTLFLLTGMWSATAASDRTRNAWQEGCQERELAVLDKCNLGLTPYVENDGWITSPTGPGPGAAPM